MEPLFELVAISRSGEENQVARGWESKSVEAQIEEGNERPSEEIAETTADSRLRQQKIESLKLSRSRVLQQLERARHPAHREMLMKGLQAIEQDIEKLASG
jgi:hypothetical protein